MNQQLKDKLVHSLLKAGKKNKNFKIPVFICVAIIIGTYRIIGSIYGNTKKILLTSCLLLFFMISSSFASINFVTTTPTVIPEGEIVKANKPLLIMEAMKMENEMRASRDVKIKEIKVKQGDSVESGTVLIKFEEP